ncbi:MAG: hypothetical protein AAF671_01950 [Pseudomonadota bacterium]
MAYLMLPDAYWAVLMPEDELAISKTLQLTGRLFVQYTNKKYRREGTLWAERYRACPIEPTSQYLACINQYLDKLPEQRGYGTGTSWPWRCSELPAIGTTEVTQRQLEQVDQALNAGAAFGSAMFISELERKTGQRAVARPRGRPRASST